MVVVTSDSKAVSTFYKSLAKHELSKHSRLDDLEDDDGWGDDWEDENDY